MKSCKLNATTARGICTLLLILSAPLVSQAQTPVIVDATVNLAKSYISLAGTNFSPSGVAPTVTLAGTSYTVFSFTNTAIVVEVPSTLAAATYLATVTNSVPQSGSAYVTVGAVGPAGPAGATGPAGPQGPAGATGASGATGPAGPTGAKGATGATGPAGPTGAKGATGSTGATGAAGPAGPQGAIGATGATGPAGAKGATGATGPAGATGAAGPGGPAGPQGPAGPTGPAGPGGGLTLPFAGTGAATTSALFNITNTNPAHSGIGGTGGQGLAGDQAGSGISGYGGASAGNYAYTSEGGDGIYGQGGVVTTGGTLGGGINDSGGTGVSGHGGDGTGGIAGGLGVRAQGGDGTDTGGDGIDAYGGNGSLFGGGNGIYAQGGAAGSEGSGGDAGYFDGEVQVNGNLSKNGGSFKIDHPLDPANKYLYHSFVESPDMMNIYNGNVVTDAGGTAVINMPAWFDALNTDFRYQLTTIGQPAQAWIASEIANGSFTIKTSKSGVKVSWQVTGIRQDAWANAHRIPVEVDKAQKDQGHYLHPELFGHAGEPNIPQTHHPRRAE